MFLVVTTGISHDPSTLVGSNLSDSTHTFASPYFTATRILAILNNATTSKSRQPSIRTRTVHYGPILGKQTAASYSDMMPARFSPSEAGSSDPPTLTAYISRYTTLTQKASYIPQSSSSLATIITANSTIHAHTANNGTVVSAPKEPHGIVAAKSVVTTVSDVAEICLRLINTLVAVYHIKMTIKLVGQCQYTIGL